MKTKMIFEFATLALLVPVLALAGPSQKNDESRAIEAAVADYAAIGASLAQDSVDGVSEAARRMAKEMDAMSAMHGHHESMSGMHSEHASMREALTGLSADDLGLDDARSAYMDLSLKFVPMANAAYAKSAEDPEWVIMHCPMAKADWIQTAGSVANPFYGSKMLRCGAKVADLAKASPEQLQSPMEDHEGHGMEGMQGMHGMHEGNHRHGN